MINLSSGSADAGGLLQGVITMLSDGAFTQAANSGFIVLGIPLSDFINAIIAIVAVAGFVTSIIISVKTLKQTKELNDKTLKETKAMYDKSLEVEMFDKKYALVSYFRDFFVDNIPNKPSDDQMILFVKNATFALSFPEFNIISNDLEAFMKYYASSKEPLPDYRKEVKEERNKDIEDVYIAFCTHMQIKLPSVHVELVKKINWS